MKTLIALFAALALSACAPMSQKAQLEACETMTTAADMGIISPATPPVRLYDMRPWKI